jgi:signal transduction histidine kinase
MRLALGYAGLFIASSLLLVGLLWWRTAGYLDREIDAVIVADTQAVAERLRDFGLPGAIEGVAERAGANGDKSAIYLLVNPLGEPMAGNLNAWPPEVGRTTGWRQSEMLHDGRTHTTRLLSVGLPGGFRLLVGRDVEDREQVRALILNGLVWAIGAALIIAALGGMLARRAVLERIESISRTTAAIVQGDLAQRVPERQSADEFDQLAHMINRMLEQIQQLIEGVRNVSNAVAHDLRTPLAEARARLEYLLRNRSGAEELFAGIEATIDEIDRLIAMSNALLRLAEIDSGVRRSGFRRVDLAEIVLEIADLYRPTAEAKAIAFNVDAPAGLTADGDPFLVAQAVGNLVDNAIKYTPTHGKIDVRIVEHGGGEVEIAVIDNGPGIADSDKARATERFYRGDSSRGKAGVGLGLSVVAAVAKLHGGGVVFTDNHPGLTASLILPVPV